MMLKRFKGRKFEGAYEKCMAGDHDRSGRVQRLVPRSSTAKVSQGTAALHRAGGQTRAGLSVAGQRMLPGHFLRSRRCDHPHTLRTQSRVTGRTLGECVRQLSVVGRPQTEECGEYAATGSIGQARSRGRTCKQVTVWCYQRSCYQREAHSTQGQGEKHRRSLRGLAARCVCIYLRQRCLGGGYGRVAGAHNPGSSRQTSTMLEQPLAPADGLGWC
jgi:hypothetical protein